MGEIRRLQLQHKVWVDHNFPNAKPHEPLLGIGEEAGELMHAHLKHEQGIRGFADPEKFSEAAQDALGDLFIYMLSYANRNGFDLETAILTTWDEMSQRDWVAFPTDGRTH